MKQKRLGFGGDASLQAPSIIEMALHRADELCSHIRCQLSRLVKTGVAAYGPLAYYDIFKSHIQTPLASGHSLPSITTLKAGTLDDPLQTCRFDLIPGLHVQA